MIEDSPIKSRPCYPAKLQLDPTGRRHVMVWLGAVAEAAVADCLAAAPGKVAAAVELHGVAGHEGGAITGYGSAAALCDGIAQLLDQARMGLRVYAIGPESFVWSIDRIATARGLGKDEVVGVVAGSLARRVLCVHCKTTHEDVTVSPYRCTNCHRTLSVRDHFSRRRGAFLGVMANAESPDRLPQPVERFK